MSMMNWELSQVLQLTSDPLYPSNTQCGVALDAGEGNTMTLTFLSFNMTSPLDNVTVNDPELMTPGGFTQSGMSTAEFRYHTAPAPSLVGSVDMCGPGRVGCNIVAIGMH
jgi:hypothetical protein